MNTILPKIFQLPPKDGFNHMIDIFNLLQSEINQYYGTIKQENRPTFYMNNGIKTDDEDVRICSMSHIKGTRKYQGFSKSKDFDEAKKNLGRV